MTKKHRSKKMSCDDDQYPKLFLYYCQGALIETKKDTKSIKLISYKFIRFLYACNICNVIRLSFTTKFTHVLIYMYNVYVHASFIFYVKMQIPYLTELGEQSEPQ